GALSSRRADAGEEVAAGDVRAGVVTHPAFVTLSPPHFVTVSRPLTIPPDERPVRLHHPRPRPRMCHGSRPSPKRHLDLRRPGPVDPPAASAYPADDPAHR